MGIHADRREADAATARGREERAPAAPWRPGAVATVQRLQRSIGNAATARLVARRSDADAPLLQDRRPLLKRGSKGEDVLDAQYQLNFLGADPPLDLDGIFGSRTKAAVVDFQSAHGLDPDGIVGPLTRGALEAAMQEHDAPGTDGPATLGRDGGGELDLGLGGDGAATPGNLLGIPAAAPPAPVKFSSSDFRAGVGDLAIANGQFLFAEDIAAHLRAEIAKVTPRTVDSKVLEDLVAGYYKPGFEALMRVQEQRPASDWNPPSLHALLGARKSRTKETGDTLVQRLWGAYKTPGAPEPSLAGMTVSDLRAAYNWEVVACFTTAERVAQKFAQATKGRGARRSSTMIPNLTTMSSISKKSGKQRTVEAASLAAGGRVDGDVVNYDPKRLPSIVAQMKTALADGWTLHARVVSGIYLDRPGPGTPNEEHSLLIYAFDGDEFHCYDPDLNSNTNIPDIGMPNSGKAFQSLFFDPVRNRLTTAKDDTTFPVDGGGRDVNGVHRYQVVRVFTANHPFMPGHRP